MSRPWHPGPRRKWTVIDGYAPARPRRVRSTGVVPLVIALAACVGIGVGFYAAPQHQMRANAANGAEAGVRANFSYCKWGGGTNCVVDGDTFWIGGQKVRIAGIDAPETHDYACDSELALGNRATDMLQQMLNSGAVTMTSIDRDRDVYGRLLRNVAVDGRDVGEAMISAGVARDYAGGRRPWC